MIPDSFLVTWLQCVNTLRTEQGGCNFADGIFESCAYFWVNVFIFCLNFTKLWKFLRIHAIDNKAALFQVMAWCWTYDSRYLTQWFFRRTDESPVLNPCTAGHARVPLWWRHNGRDCVSNHQPHDCLLNRLFGRRSKKTSKLCVTGLCVGNSPGPVNSPHKWPVTRKMFPFDDVIMRTQDCIYWCGDAKAPVHQYPRCWLNIHCIKPVSYRNIKIIGNNIRKWNYILKTNTQLFLKE